MKTLPATILKEGKSYNFVSQQGDVAIYEHVIDKTIYIDNLSIAHLYRYRITCLIAEVRIVTPGVAAAVPFAPNYHHLTVFFKAGPLRLLSHVLLEGIVKDGSTFIASNAWAI